MRRCAALTITYLASATEPLCMRNDFLLCLSLVYPIIVCLSALLSPSREGAKVEVEILEIAQCKRALRQAIGEKWGQGN